MARPKEKETIMTKQGKKTFRLRKDWSGKKETWRKSAFTEEVVKKLEESFSWNSSVKTACALVGISRNAYYEECKRNPAFNDRMERAQEYVSSLADRTIAKAIRDGDVATAKWMKERSDERYKQKPAQISMSQGVDPETGETTQGLLVEFTLKE